MLSAKRQNFSRYLVGKLSKSEVTSVLHLKHKSHNSAMRLIKVDIWFYSAAHLCVHLLPFDLGESHAGEVHRFCTQTTNYVQTPSEFLKLADLNTLKTFQPPWFPHLSLQSGTSQTWWRPRQLQWPVWRRGTPAADGAGCCCLCLLLPGEARQDAAYACIPPQKKGYEVFRLNRENSYIVCSP